MSDSQPHHRIPYESEERLQDKEQKRQSRSQALLPLSTPKSDAYTVTEILGLNEDHLTNSDPLPLPELAGARRVKKFRNVSVMPHLTTEGPSTDLVTTRLDSRLAITAI